MTVLRLAGCLLALVLVIGVAPPVAANSVDHFQCYEALDLAPLFQPRNVTLEDEFGTWNTRVTALQRLCNPVNKNGEGIQHPNAHLTCYAINHVAGQPAFQARTVRVVDQFGELTLSVTAPQRLCVPSEKNHVDFSFDLDHYKCYKASRKVGTPPFVRRDGVSLVDQFGPAVVSVERPVEYCLPVDKNGEGVRDTATQLTCYEVAPPDTNVRQRQIITNQFGEDRVEIGARRTLCVPSVANPCEGQANGTPCDDGNACTQTDTCQAGQCVGSNPVVCTASDQCHNAGTCNPATGACSNPAKPNGSTCNDGNACTQTDTCQGGVCTGSNPVVCTAQDQCHNAGTCDPGTGACSNPAKPDGASCDDSNKCTQTDTCEGGVCTGGNPVVCTASDQCHDVGTCDPATAVCSNPVKPDGASCDDGNACTTNDTCSGGSCVGGPPPNCNDGITCTDDSCDPGSGCVNSPNHAVCDDGNDCTSDVCNPSEGDPSTGCQNPDAPAGTTCTDTDDNLCNSGACDGGGSCVPTGCGAFGAGGVFKECPINRNCFCVTTVEGQDACFDGGTSCFACTSSAQCQAVFGTAFGGQWVCGSTSLCGGSACFRVGNCPSCFDSSE